MPIQTKPALPFVPYEGPEPYIFVSYAHANADKVYPIIARLHEMGYRLWYDEGILSGEEWPKVLGDHLVRSWCMLLFLSPEAVASEWVHKEIHAAIEKKIKLIGTFLTDTALPSSLFLQLSNVQMLLYDDEAYWERLCRGIPGKILRPPMLPPSSQPKPTPSPLMLTPAPVNDFAWKIESDGMATVTKYMNQKATKRTKYKVKGIEFAIPSTFDGRRVGKIGEYAFNVCHSIMRIEIPDGIRSLDRGAFQGCHNLNHVILPQSVLGIGSAAFLNCTSLTDIWIPASVNYIYPDNNSSSGVEDHGVFESSILPRNPALTFHCPRGSYAEQYAKARSINIIYTD